MGPDHPYPPHGPHWEGVPFWSLWPVVPTLVLGSLIVLLMCWVLARDLGGTGLTGAAPREPGARSRWRAATARHRAVATAFAAYECDPEAVLRRPGLADVRQPATARFVEAFAEACALATDRYPGRDVAEAFAVAADRAARAWSAAGDAAERLRAVQFAPGEQALLDQASALLALARQSPHEGERVAAYRKAGQRLAELERRCGWALPQPATAVLRHEARPALAGSAAT
jgi:hypothetical protein